MLCTRRALLHSRRLSYTHACTERSNGGWDGHMRPFVRVCAIHGRGMRRQRRCWVWNGRLEALRHCGKFLESTKRGVRTTTKRMTKNMKIVVIQLRAVEPLQHTLMSCFRHKIKLCVLQWMSCKIKRQQNFSVSRVVAVYN